MHKVVWNDGNNSKAVSGELISEDNDFLFLKTDTGCEFMIAKKHIVVIKSM